jgi:hypothetical protein
MEEQLRGDVKGGAEAGMRPLFRSRLPLSTSRDDAGRAKDIHQVLLPELVLLHEELDRFQGRGLSWGVPDFGHFGAELGKYASPTQYVSSGTVRTAIL